MLPSIDSSPFNEIYRLQAIDVLISRRGLDLLSMTASWLLNQMLSEQFVEIYFFEK
jgi:hypothetical protein